MLVWLQVYVYLRKSTFENEIFSEILISKMNVKKNLTITTASNAADLEKGFLKKLILQTFGLTCPYRQRRS